MLNAFIYSFKHGDRKLQRLPCLPARCCNVEIEVCVLIYVPSVNDLCSRPSLTPNLSVVSSFNTGG